jgi:acyl phosphate:glycerol-3-phosphate acyltransferase
MSRCCEYHCSEHCMLFVLAGYIAGSVPFAFLLARRAGIDVRIAGSGNVGAANVLRTAGARRGVLVMALDVAKGAAAVLLAQAVTTDGSTAALTGAAAIIGHIYPVWLRFHGGKGVAVAAGVFGILAPAATAIAAVMFLVTVWITRYVSLGSVAAAVALSPVAWLAGASPPTVIVAAGTGALIVFRHRANVRRLLSGTARRMGAPA